MNLQGDCILFLKCDCFEQDLQIPPPAHISITWNPEQRGVTHNVRLTVHLHRCYPCYVYQG